MPDPPTSNLSVRRKAILSAFIVVHWGCVFAWLLPPSALKSWVFARRLPLPGRDAPVAGGAPEWNLRWRPVVPAYLHHTAQWQDWSMFAPDPLTVNRFVAATVFHRDGSSREVELPRLSRLGPVGAWIEKRWRKYQYRLIEDRSPRFLEDFARYAARRAEDPANPVIRVTVFQYEQRIPRHDRPEVRGPGAPAWTDYTRLLRDTLPYARFELYDHWVAPPARPGGA